MFETKWACPTCHTHNTKQLPFGCKVVVERVKCAECATIAEIFVELQPVVTQVRLKCTPIDTQ